jgi:hypothetical protein
MYVAYSGVGNSTSSGLDLVPIGRHGPDFSSSVDNR